MSQNKPLSARRIAFAHHYVANGFNGTQAAISAGYSEDTATSQAERLLRNVDIKKIVDNLKQKAIAKAESTTDSLIRMVDAGIDFDPTTWFDLDERGGLILNCSLSDLPVDVRRLIQGFKQTKFGVEVQFVSKQFLIDMKARMHSLYKDKVTVTNSYENLPDDQIEARLKELGE